jgi:hypothetical protein
MISFLFIFIYRIVDNRKECLGHLKREKKTPLKREITWFLHDSSENEQSLCENRKNHDI